MRARIGITSTPATHDGRSVEEANRPYVDAVLRAGGLPLVLPVLDPAEHGDLAPDLLADLDGLVLTGGGDVDSACYGAVAAPEVDGVDPARDRWELALVAAALDWDMPVLGVCRGQQVLNVALGGTLVQHLPDVTDHSHREKERFAEEIHPVELQAGSRVAAIMDLDRLGVNTLHHQAVGRVGRGVRPVGWGPDGVIEAIEIVGRRVLAVQWHPELLTERTGHLRLFEWLVADAAGLASRSVHPSALHVLGSPPLGGLAPQPSPELVEVAPAAALAVAPGEQADSGLAVA